MLTLEQKEKLEPLTHHEKYGKILIDAMKTWETVTPNTGIFGVRIISNTFTLLNNSTCCLIGASLAGKTAIESDDLSTESFKSLKLNEIVMWDIIRGFDSFRNQINIKSEPFIFGRTVADIVLSEK